MISFRLAFFLILLGSGLLIGNSMVSAQNPEVEEPDADIEFQQADSLRDKLEYAESVRLYKSSANGFKDSGQWERYVESLNDLVKAFDKLWLSDSADFYAGLALETGIKELGPSHPRVAKTYERLGDLRKGSGNYREAIAFYEKALAIRIKEPDPDPDVIAKNYNKIGSIYRKIGAYDQAMDFHQKALAFLAEGAEKSNDPEELGDTYKSMGTIYKKKGYFRLALEYYLKSLEIHLSLSGGQHPEIALIYNNLGDVYASLGDYVKAQDYYAQGLVIRREVYGESHPETASSYGHLGFVSEKRKDFDRARVYYLKALQIRQPILGKVHPKIADLFENLGSVYMEIGKYDSARTFFRDCLQIRRSVYGQIHPDISRVLLRLGDSYARAGNTNEALRNYQLALSLGQSLSLKGHPYLARAHTCIGKVLASQGKRREGLDNFNMALRILSPDFEPAGPDDNPPLSGVHNPLNFLEALKAKAEVQLSVAAESHVQADLQAAMKTALLASEMIDQLRNSFGSDGSKLDLMAEAVPVFELGIGAAFLLYQEKGDRADLEQAFRLAEKSKATLLIESMQEANALRFAGIPDSLLEREEKLRVDLAYAKSQLAKASVSAEDQQEKFRLQDEIFALSGAYEALKTRLANLHPEYYRLKYAGTTVGISTIQAKLLKPDEILVEFFLGESALFTFVVSRDTAFMSRTMLPEGFQAAVLDFYDDIRNQRHDPAGYLIKASGFYKLLLEPIMPYVTGESLLIVPDGILSYLPFDALVEKPDPDISSYYQMEFLVQKYAIRYSYSCSLLEEVSQNRAAVRKNRYLAFAPDFGKTGTEKDPARADLPPLSGAMREIQLLSHHMKGSSYSGTAATETEFKRSGPQYSILHFATHALVDDAFPMNSRMLFARDAGSGEDGDLYAWELYNMKLHADLAVLSACNTGIGKLQRGEGVMSLGRAFFYSGVPAILMSLWPAQDQSTAEIMGVFYARLSKGATKPEALQAGKKAYLDSADELTSHPFYWAGFVMQGDPKPVAMGREFPGKWLLTAGLFLFFGLSWIYFRKKTSRKVKS